MDERNELSRVGTLADEQSPGEVDRRRAFRLVMGRFPTGVAVMTTAWEGQWHGATVNAVSSLSLEPLLLLVCLRKGSTLGRMVTASRCFALTFLSDHQLPVARYFADAGRAWGSEQFATLDVALGRTGCPYLRDGTAMLECRLWAVYDGGDHQIFCGEVVAMAMTSRSPLVFHAGRYRQVGSDVAVPAPGNGRAHPAGRQLMEVSPTTRRGKGGDLDVRALRDSS